VRLAIVADQAAWRAWARACAQRLEHLLHIWWEAGEGLMTAGGGIGVLPSAPLLEERAGAVGVANALTGWL
jgi:hypothetical protein